MSVCHLLTSIILAHLQFTARLDVKISDAGISHLKQIQEQQVLSSNYGTSYFQAPEVQIDGKRAQKYSDIWSACLLGTEWLTGIRSWQSTGPEGYMIMKSHQRMPTQLSQIKPVEVREFLTDGLCYDHSTSRPSANIITTILNQQLLEVSILFLLFYIYIHGQKLSIKWRNPKRLEIHRQIFIHHCSDVNNNFES